MRYFFLFHQHLENREEYETQLIYHIDQLKLQLSKLQLKNVINLNETEKKFRSDEIELLTTCLNCLTHPGFNLNLSDVVKKYQDTYYKTYYNYFFNRSLTLSLAKKTMSILNKNQDHLNFVP